jgi:hypothetical protein
LASTYSNNAVCEGPEVDVNWYRLVRPVIKYRRDMLAHLGCLLIVTTELPTTDNTLLIIIVVIILYLWLRPKIQLTILKDFLKLKIYIHFTTISSNITIIKIRMGCRKSTIKVSFFNISATITTIQFCKESLRSFRCHSLRKTTSSHSIISMAWSLR